MVYVYDVYDLFKEEYIQASVFLITILLGLGWFTYLNVQFSACSSSKLVSSLTFFIFHAAHFVKYYVSKYI